MKKTSMASPFADPRTGQLYFRRAVPDALRTAFDGKAQVKVTLGTKDPVAAKAAFARENAKFEEQLVDARRRMAEGTLLPTPAALVRRWCEGTAVDGGLTGPQRLIMTFMELDAAVGGRYTASASDIYPPAMLGPAANTNWAALLTDKARFDAVLSEGYGGDAEQAGTNWIRARWYTPEEQWVRGLAGPVARLRAFDDSAARFADDDLAKALLAIVDEKRTGDEEVNRARLARHRPRTQQPRLRPHMRLKQLYTEWKAGNKPRPQSALEYEAAVDDFIDFAGDVAVSTIDADILYDYRDEAAKLPATMPRVDRALPFRARVAKHANADPKIAAPTLKKRIGALQALLTYAFQQRWTAANAGTGILIVGYSKKRRTRRSFEDHELAKLCECPLFVDPQGWSSSSKIGDATIFWIFLLAITTGARLEEVGQVALADVKRDGEIVYLDIDEYAADEEAPDKSVKTDDSVRLVPVHAKLIELGFLNYYDALIASGETQLFPDLKENSVGKRTKEASQRMNRIIDRHVSVDRRLVFHSLRHAFKAKGNDAGITDKTLDQICGHAPVSTGSRYGAEPRVRTIHRELHLIDFSCIDWDRVAEGVSKISWATNLRNNKA
ncbi:site-specific integrase [Sphingomonas sp. 10B4]|uniref:site-specific integrase n=1 Tax=Sphingomonas sp. 10B4 TaxID=3048575 RepID=UPI002AB5B4AB|nr:site-specific integrase [Sphingomonas sp. 10B4]MDY7524636.1 site-specific integrase [Sphingomonas sp. 10B4]MEB0282409.1 site-specific integrase [Sphingomonas sp. 10B4]